MIKQDILEKQAKCAFIAIGSNLGNKRLNIELAKFKLQNNSIKIIQSSGNYETDSWPDPNKPKFINIVVKIKKVPQSPFSQSTRAPEDEARVVLPAVPIDASNAY